MRDKKFLTIHDMVLIAVFTALISVCSLIQIPLGPIPFTMQNFAVFITAGVLGVKRGTLSIIAYILLGIAGVPVFRGMGGPGVIAGPTGGYILGFIFSVIIIGVITYFIKTDRVWLNTVIMMAAMILGDVVCFIVGTIQFMFITKTSLVAALGYCVIPFVVPDLIKIVAAAIIVNRMKKYIKIIK